MNHIFVGSFRTWWNGTILCCKTEKFEHGYIYKPVYEEMASKSKAGKLRSEV